MFKDSDFSAVEVTEGIIHLHKGPIDSPFFSEPTLEIADRFLSSRSPIGEMSALIRQCPARVFNNLAVGRQLRLFIRKEFTSARGTDAADR
jgi:hypothetical protein